MTTKNLTRTAIILALTILFQSLGRFLPLGGLSQFVTGSLVNACLLVAAAFTGIWGGAAVALLSPFGAILTGATVPLPFAPFIAVGNFILVLMYIIIRKNKILGMALGAVLKFAFLFGAVTLFVDFMGIPQQKAAAMTTTFSWPQLVTAAIGSALAFVVIKALSRATRPEKAEA
jgi:hypothetical protein